jgi:hypothetical protein
MPAAKRRKVEEAEMVYSMGVEYGHDRDGGARQLNANQTPEAPTVQDEEYWGSMPADQVRIYESRIDDIFEDMEDLNVEDIKTQVLNTHVQPKTRPSSSHSHEAAAEPPPFLTYTKMDDFTAMVTATVLRALPYLSKLMKLLDVWSVRLAILRQLPSLDLAMEDAEIALKAGWNSVQDNFSDGVLAEKTAGLNQDAVLTRESYEIMRDVLKDKVTSLGQQLDHMLDTLEGREDTLPEALLDRMEAIEQDYSDWAVSADRKVREGEWAREAAERRRWKESQKSPSLEEEPEAMTFSGSLEDPLESPPMHEEEEGRDIVVDDSLDEGMLEVQGLIKEYPRPLSPDGLDKNLLEKSAKPIFEVPEQQLEKGIATQPDFSDGEIAMTDSVVVAQFPNVALDGAMDDSDILADAIVKDEDPTTDDEKPWMQDVIRIVEIMSSYHHQHRIIENIHKEISDAGSEFALSEINEDVQARQVGSILDDIPALSLPVDMGIGCGISGFESDEPSFGPRIPLCFHNESALDVVTVTLPPIPVEILGRNSVFESQEPSFGPRIPICFHNESALDVVTAILPIPIETPGRDFAFESDEPSFGPRIPLCFYNESALDVVTVTQPLIPVGIPGRNSVFESEELSFGPRIPLCFRDESALDVVAFVPPQIAVEISCRENGFKSYEVSFGPRIPLCFRDEQTSIVEILSVTSTDVEKGLDVLITPIRPETPGGHDTDQSLEEMGTTGALSTSGIEMAFGPRIPLCFQDEHHAHAPAIMVASSIEVIDNDPNATTIVSEIYVQDGPLDDKDTKISLPQHMVEAHLDQDENTQDCEIYELPFGPRIPLCFKHKPEIVSPESSIELFSSIENKGDPAKTATFDRPQTPVRGFEEVLLGPPRTPPPASEDSIDRAIMSPSNQPIVVYHLEDGGTPRSPSKKPRLDDGGTPRSPTKRTRYEDSSGDSPQAIKLARPENPFMFSDEKGFGNQDNSNIDTEPRKEPTSPKKLSIAIPQPMAHLSPFKSPAKKGVVKSMAREYAVVVPQTLEDFDATEPLQIPTNRDDNRVISASSTVSGHSLSGPSPEVQEAESAFCLKPAFSPAKARHDWPQSSPAATPTRSSFHTTASSPDISPTNYTSETVPPARSRHINNYFLDGAHDSENSGEYMDVIMESIEIPSDPPTPSIVNDGCVSPGPKEIIIPQHDGALPKQIKRIHDAWNKTGGESIEMSNFNEPSIESPRIVEDLVSDSEDFEEPKSPHFDASDQYDCSPPSTPPPLPPLSMRRKQQTLTASPESSFESMSPDESSLAIEPPSFDNVDVSSTPLTGNSMKSSDSQLQQQISDILESIPAKIHLTSEPHINRPVERVKVKKRASLSPIIPAARPSISRASTPSFTLAPAKSPRHRPQVHYPEIKLYHLSRSTGEAPIKLFVRLVGEQGERVMVRVGGGWADLGEYLKEYASHHGRRSERASTIEIDLPQRPRLGSTGSLAPFGGGPRSGAGWSSPISRPGSSLERPVSSLQVRKMRKSEGPDVRLGVAGAQRSPSTPLAFTSGTLKAARPSFSTPPLASGRSVSRQGWEGEEAELGLAGPMGRKVEIDEDGKAWVENMKERVRKASAEKEKKNLEFGALERVGGTKRLFKRGV